MGFGRPAICASSVEPFSVERGSPPRLAFPAASAGCGWRTAIRRNDSRPFAWTTLRGGGAGLPSKAATLVNAAAATATTAARVVSASCALRRGAEMTVSDCSSGLDRMRSTKSQSAAAYVAHAAQCRRCAASQAVCHLLNSPLSRIEIIQRDRTQLSDGRLDRRSVRLTLTSLRMGSLRGEYEHSPTHRRPRGQDRGRPARRTSRPVRPRSGAHCVPARR